MVVFDQGSRAVVKRPSLRDSGTIPVQWHVALRGTGGMFAHPSGREGGPANQQQNNTRPLRHADSMQSIRNTARSRRQPAPDFDKAATRAGHSTHALPHGSNSIPFRRVARPSGRAHAPSHRQALGSTRRARAPPAACAAAACASSGGCARAWPGPLPHSICIPRAALASVFRPRPRGCDRELPIREPDPTSSASTLELTEAPRGRPRAHGPLRPPFG